MIGFKRQQVDCNEAAIRAGRDDHSPDKEAMMGSFTLLRCLVCYHEGKAETFLPKTPTASSEYECPECLNNDSDYFEETGVRELVAV
jgi:hypothetical protein